MLNQQPSLGRIFRALGDPTRRAIVEQLSHGEASVSQIAKPMPVSLAAIMQHVQILEASGLISTRKRGRLRLCALETRSLSVLEGWIAQRRETRKADFDRLGTLLNDERQIEK